MSVISKFKSWVKKTFGGGSNKSSTSSRKTKRASRVSNYGGGGSRSYRDYSSGGYRSDYEDRQEAERRRRQEQARRRQATTEAFASISKRTDALSTGRSPSAATSATSAGNGYKAAIKKIEQKAKSVPPEPKITAKEASKDRATKMLKRIEADRRSYNKATGNKYNADTGNKTHDAMARQRIKSGEYQSDPRAAKWEYTAHPKATMAARTVANAAALGIPDAAARKLERYASPEMQEAEAIYRRNQEEHPWIRFGAELGGSLIGFGGTAKLTDALGARAINKLAPNAAKNLARSRLGQKIATRTVNKAVRRGLAEEASDLLIEKVGLEKATRIVNALGAEGVQNLTTGAVYDIANATKDHELFSGDWWKELGDSAKFNLLSTSLVGGWNALGGNKELVSKAVKSLAKQDGAENAVRRAVETEYDKILKASEERNSLLGVPAQPTPTNLDDAIERAAVETVEARGAVGQVGEAIRPQSINDAVEAEYGAMSNAERQAEYNRLTEEYEALSRQADRITTPTDEAAEYYPRLDEIDERLTVLEQDFGAGDAPQKSDVKISLGKKRRGDFRVNTQELRQEMRGLRAEREAIVKEIEEEFGSIRVDYNKLTPEQRAWDRERRLRLREIDNRIEGIADTLKTDVRRVAKTPKRGAPKASRAEREAERDALAKEYSKLRKDVQAAEKARNAGGKVDEDAIGAKTARMDELKSRMDEIDRNLGTQARQRKTRTDAGSKKKKAQAPNAKMSKADIADVAESAKSAEPRKYEDIDLSEGLTKEDRKVIRSKMKELDAERNRLAATDENNPRIEELGAEVSNIKRALRRKVGEPAKKKNLDALRAKKAAEEAEAKAARNANAKPINNTAKVKDADVEPAKPKAPKAKETKPAKPEPPKTEKQKIVDSEKAHAKAARDAHERLDEAGKALRKATDNKYNVRGSTNTAVELGSTEQDKRYIKQASKLIKDLENGIVDTDSGITYKVMTREERDKIAKEAFVRARKSPDEIIRRLETAVNDDDILTIKDVADMQAVTNLYHELGEKIPESVEALSGRVQMQALTEKAQGLKSISLFLRENDPFYRKRYLNKDLAKFRELVCNESDWSKISASLDRKHKTKDFLDNEIKRLSELTGAENDEEFRKAYVNLQKEIWRNSEPTLWELLNLARHTFMLGSLKTSDNNIIGNLSQSSMWEVSDKMDAIAEAMLSKTNMGKGMRRTTTVKVKNKDLTTFMNQIRSGAVAEAFEEAGARPREYGDAKLGKLLEDARAEDVGDAMGTSKYGFKADKGWDYQYDNKLKKHVARAIQAPAKAVGFMLSEPDSWFVERNYRKALARYLDINGIDTAEKWLKNEDLVREAREYAKDVALENTYKKASRLVSILEGQRAKGYRKNSKWADILKTIGLDAELPYLKVPYNLIVNNFKYSPVGLTRQGFKAIRAAHSGDIEALTKATKEMSKGLTGTGMMIAGFYLNCDDQMDDDSWGFIGKAKDHLKEYGVRDNSFKIGNRNYNLANFGIGTVEFLMGARLAESYNEIGGAPESFLDYPEAVMSAFGTTFDVVSSMSLMENGLALFDAISNAGDYDMELSERLYNVGAKVAGDYVGQYIPAPVRAVAKSFTDADLDTGVKKGKATTRGQRTLQRNVNNVINSIPVVNEKVLPHKVDRHGNLVNERKTSADKWKTLETNLTNPFSPKEVNIPEPDKIEMSLKKDDGTPYQPKGYDENRTYKAKIGQGGHAEFIDLTGKEREQAARSYKNSGEDMADNLVYSTDAWFGDSHGKRAQEILRNVPVDEEEARKYFYSTPEFQRLSPERKLEFVKDLYDVRRGRGRTANHEVYVNIKGGDEGDFRFQNDLAWQQQDKYENYHLADVGISKGQWADIVEAARFESHKYKDGKNVDTINSAWKLKAALMNLDLTPEQRVAAYQAYRGKRNGFGWYDWDGASLKGSYKRRRGYRRYRRRWRGYSSSKKAKVPTPKAIKASQFTQGTALGSTTKSASTTKSSAKATPPTLKRVEAKIDLPTVKTTTKKR